MACASPAHRSGQVLDSKLELGLVSKYKCNLAYLGHRPDTLISSEKHTHMKNHVVGILFVPFFAFLIGIYFVSYSTIPPIRAHFEGDSFIVYDPEIGFVPRPGGRTKVSYFSTPWRPSFSFNLYTDARGARITTPGQNNPARIEIMTIGCSFTWGHGVENHDQRP
jgi:hypothetical protein